MSLNHTVNPFKNPAEVTALVAALGELLEQKNCDFRTLSQTKRLHTISELFGFENWQKFSAHLVKSEFFHTMMETYGLGDQYANAAWTTLSDRSGPGKLLADNYCSRFKFQHKPIIDELPDDIKGLCEWLHANSAGTYRKSAEAAEIMKIMYSKIKSLEQQIESLNSANQ